MITLFREQVEKHGDKVALSDPSTGKSVTYGQLDENARRIAAKLISDGLKHGEPVLIIASRSIGFVEAILGILMEGGAYVPLSDHYPADRTEFIRNNCGAKAVIDDEFIANCAQTAPIEKPTEVRPEDTALIVYTSGSTGTPKGIAHDHRSIKESVTRYMSFISLGAKDLYGVNAPFYFIAHLFDLLACLAYGIEAVLIPEWLRGDPVNLAGFIQEHKITATFISPKVLRYFKSSGDSLRIVNTGSERVSQIFPENFRLFNTYGMSETACLVAAFEVDRLYDNTPIGKALIYTFSMRTEMTASRARYAFREIWRGNISGFPSRLQIHSPKTRSGAGTDTMYSYIPATSESACPTAISCT